MTKTSLEEQFALKKIEPDKRVKHVRFLKPEVLKAWKEMQKEAKNSVISPDLFNNKGKKQQKRNKKEKSTS
tara:strand:- start:3022 stop:3234 length:213 start_codon:yes stop_codon:yes gene_type:complete